MNNRIKQIRKSINLSQEAFGAKLGVSRSVINNLERGLTDLREPLATLFCSTYNVNKDWLINGVGDIFVQNSNNLIQNLQHQYNLSSKACNIVENFLKLDKESRDSFVQLAEQIFYNEG